MDHSPEDHRAAALSEPPSLTVDGAVATLQLRRPARANRIEVDDIQVIREHCADLSRRAAAVRALVITGVGKYFSAGYDISSLLDTVLAGDTASFDNGFSAMVADVEALPQVTVCALNGPVFGGSTDLTLACDFRVGVPDTRLCMPAVQFGLHYPSQGLRRYVARLGVQQTKRIFLLSQELDAQQLKDMGYLDAVVPTDQLRAHVLAMAREAAAGAPLASAGMKATLNAIAAGCFDLEAAARAEQTCLRSSDLREGLTSWKEKRAPRFEGR